MTLGRICNKSIIKKVNSSNYIESFFIVRPHPRIDCGYLMGEIIILVIIQRLRK